MSPTPTPAPSTATYDRLYLDVTVLANLATADVVGVVTETVENPRTSYAVRNELASGVDAGYDSLRRALDCLAEPLDGPEAGGIAVAGSLVRQRKPELLERLASSEASVLYQAWAAGVPLAVDDEDVRAVARSYQVPVTGSLAIVARAVERDVLTVEAADDALDRWRAADVAVPVDSVSRLLDAGGDDADATEG
jgi:predicted nucleic acid-binding protein